MLENRFRCHRRAWLWALMALGAGCGATSACAAERPNIVFILADDLGWTDLACQGSKYYVTPHIDRLAAEGLQFTDAYTCGPNCQPTRAALLSGQYAPRTGVYTVGSIDRFNWQSRPLRPVDNVAKLPLEKITVAQALKQAGYATGMFGKWHLGNDAEHHPSQRGFQEAIASSGRHFDFRTDPAQDVPEGAYLADWLTDRAVDFLKRHKDEPFFLYLPHFGVHSPHEAKEDVIARFQDKPAAGGHHSPVYAAMIASVDESVGRVMATLKELDLERKTLVIFSSDNGGVGGYQAAGVKKANSITDNAPLRGGKGMLYEGGVRVAFMARWPGVIEAGKTSATPILSVDLYPTLLEVAGVSPPQDYPLDGRSIVPVLKSGGAATLDRALFWHFPGYLGAGMNDWRTTPVGAVRRGDWKLLEFFEDGRLELYNLAQDLGQKRDLASAEPQRVQSLHAELVAWRKQIGAKMPTANTARAGASN
jgi:arylsulfatase A-like enzyme